MIDQYEPIVAKIGPMFDAQDSVPMNGAENFSLTFTFFSSAFYAFIGSNLLVIILFIISKFYIIRNRKILSKKIHEKVANTMDGDPYDI